MVGDRAVDVLAGAAFGLQTALLAGEGVDDGVGDGPVARHAATDELNTLRARSVQPSFCGRDLRDFAGFILGNGHTSPPSTD